jgi:flagellar basal-body rod protein FlgF
MGQGGQLLVDGVDAVTVNADGEVLQKERSAGRLRTVELKRHQLVRGPDGHLHAREGQSPTELAATRVKTGQLEGSNVQTSTEMVDLMQTQRVFEAMQRLLTTYDQHVESAIQRLSDF